MIGFLEATKGEAFIAGKNIRTDINEVYKSMGVCPQHDLIWETLTAREHLNFYGRLKGLSGAKLDAAVDEVLQSVRLLDVKNKRCGKFSGGAVP
jgi:ABC-type multidrug transport system ATPase subunit